MTTAIGIMNVEYPNQPQGIVHAFATYLASNANRIGNRCALGFYLQGEMEQMATEYIGLYPTDSEQVDDLNDWIMALPWPRTGYLALTFNW